MKSLRVLIAVFAGLILIGVFATPASASAAPSCSGFTSGLCLYRDAGTGGVNGHDLNGHNQPWLGNWTYYSTSTSMNDSASSARNYGSCTAFLYWDINYGNGSSGGPLTFASGTVLSNMGSWNDKPSSVYWNC